MRQTKLSSNSVGKHKNKKVNSLLELWPCYIFSVHQSDTGLGIFMDQFEEDKRNEKLPSSDKKKSHEDEAVAMRPGKVRQPDTDTMMISIMSHMNTIVFKVCPSPEPEVWARSVGM